MPTNTEPQAEKLGSVTMVLWKETAFPAYHAAFVDFQNPSHIAWWCNG